MEPRITSPASNTGVAIEAIIWVLMAVAILVFISRITRKAEKVAETDPETMATAERPSLDWDDLARRAQIVVEQTINGLPEELKSRAKSVPCIYHNWPGEGDADMLGQFSGFEEDRISEEGAVIFLYLGSIHEEAAEMERTFEEEVRTTFLHEFGHYLGLDEDDLDARGLS